MSKLRVGIINYGVGNLGSVQNAFTFVQTHFSDILPHTLEVKIESHPEKLQEYDKLLLPGVGAFGNAMAHLKDSHLDEAIKEFAQSGKYLIGICLGMQLLFEQSAEFGNHKGLGLIEGEVVRFGDIAPLKVPHIGWNSCDFTPQGVDSKLFTGIADGSFFYFVHSFHIQTQPRFILAQCTYSYPFGAIVAKDNLFAIQAHPEKSHNVGLKLLANFLAL
ncbi:imidazole glycerol phosphate synthase subunit HisH [Helicobacter sp. MIT 21-1697]|uniref:imidazole glycerol phosphate synthase subunit HisH n=1 Tax=Helicobacter sp. MIT 21-1697 TaxID=2993733 RepID=UPI00224AE9C8|nr:imidazole glycerol phosphate synthase subunit HisH [Helicobacter sp. MIT 21-1697]MCX2716370.1 imidazole glycerol phosphate synthase subunit HisH [Helicobacter sp. MIT 21-1697]